MSRLVNVGWYVSVGLLALVTVSCADEPGEGEFATATQALVGEEALAGPTVLMNEMGITPDGASPSIIGGSPSAPEEWPWQATLGETGDPTLLTTTVYPHFCGGSVIDEKWVMTAAHCVFGTEENSIVVRLGVTQRSTPPTSDVQIRGIENIVIHPNYTTSTSWRDGDDIALLELNEPLEFTSAVRPIALATVDPPENSTAHVSGWGRVDGSISTQSDELMDVAVTVRSNATCNAEFTWRPDPVNDSMLCAGDVAGAVGHCNGDSGGPLVHRSSATAPWTQVGIVSWVKTGCTSYSVYTRVTHDEAWVRSIVPSAFRNGDLDRSGCVDGADADLVLDHYGSSPPAGNILVDTNNDGIVDSIDYYAVLGSYGSGC